MKKSNMFAALSVACLMVAASAHASTVSWTQWNAGFTTSATAGSATGTTVGPLSVGVTYSGEVETIRLDNYPSWTPSSSYTGGIVGNAPPPAGGIIQLFGGGSNVNTITFAHAVTNPVMAIWSLGQTNNEPSFTFTNDEPFTIVAGGPSAEYGGATITKSPTSNSVNGVEGNGVIVFNGTFNSISWTNPTFENWYGFTVGVPAVPLPAGVAGGGALLLALGGMKAARRMRRRA